MSGGWRNGSALVFGVSYITKGCGFNPHAARAFYHFCFADHHAEGLLLLLCVQQSDVCVLGGVSGLRKKPKPTSCKMVWRSAVAGRHIRRTQSIRPNEPSSLPANGSLCWTTKACRVTDPNLFICFPNTLGPMGQQQYCLSHRLVVGPPSAPLVRWARHGVALMPATREKQR
ncbi:hypothetical protein IWZ03DRAFT_182997 [Phyllosticta citriasiana]|uniref:Uncharacterized protein n=1 Tax=Phyllosticta citriasiana TaxID=595635 RepID=A0ABR1KPJ1_9PEZI